MLSREELEALVGRSACRRLLRLPIEYRRREQAAAATAAQQQLPGDDDGISDEAIEAEAATMREAFIRRYSVDTRPWNPFHQDSYRLTVNVALSDLSLIHI